MLGVVGVVALVVACVVFFVVACDRVDDFVVVPEVTFKLVTVVAGIVAFVVASVVDVLS